MKTKTICGTTHYYPETFFDLQDRIISRDYEIAKGVWESMHYRITSCTIDKYGLRLKGYIMETYEDIRNNEDGWEFVLISKDEAKRLCEKLWCMGRRILPAPDFLSPLLSKESERFELFWGTDKDWCELWEDYDEPYDSRDEYIENWHKEDY